MPITQYLILYVPSLFLGVLIVASLVLLSIGGLCAVRRFVSHELLKIHNDVAGAIFSTLGMAYTVLLAFVVVVVWQAYDLASSNVEREANAVVDLYRNCESFAPAEKEKLRGLLASYRDAVAGDEWKALARGQESEKAAKILDALYKVYSGFSARTATEQVFFQESVRSLNVLCNLRNDRLIASRTGMPLLLWFILIFGGVTTVAFVFFFGSENFRAQMAMTVLLASLIGLILLAVLVFDFPFTGDVSITPEAFTGIKLN